MLFPSTPFSLATAVLLFLTNAAFGQSSAPANLPSRDPMSPFHPQPANRADTPPPPPDTQLEAPDETGNTDAENHKEKTELDLPEAESLKLRIDPILPGHVVDRITEDATIYLTGLHAPTVAVFYVPVDAPYGGKAIGKPRLIGEAKVHSRQASLMWNGKQNTKYIKVFAVERRGEELVRSHTYDFAIGGSRLVAP